MANHGILLADTKFEFGTLDGEPLLIDEALTPDSSRFWPEGEYEIGCSPPSLDKQILRDHLETLDWNKEYPAPHLDPAVLERVRAGYLNICRTITGSLPRAWSEIWLRGSTRAHEPAAAAHVTRLRLMGPTAGEGMERVPPSLAARGAIDTLGHVSLWASPPLLPRAPRPRGGRQAHSSRGARTRITGTPTTTAASCAARNGATDAGAMLVAVGEGAREGHGGVREAGRAGEEDGAEDVAPDGPRDLLPVPSPHGQEDHEEEPQRRDHLGEPQGGFERLRVPRVTAGKPNWRCVTATPSAPPATCATIRPGTEPQGVPPSTASERVTAGLKCAPEIGPNATISAPSANAVARAFSRSCRPSSAGLSLWAATPEPTIAARRRPVPRNSPRQARTSFRSAGSGAGPAEDGSRIVLTGRCRVQPVPRKRHAHQERRGPLACSNPPLEVPAEPHEGHVKARSPPFSVRSVRQHQLGIRQNSTGTPAERRTSSARGAKDERPRRSMR